MSKVNVRFSLFTKSCEDLSGLSGENLSYGFGVSFMETITGFARHASKTNWKYANTRWNSERSMKRIPRQHLGASGEIVTAALVAANGTNVSLTPKHPDHDIAVATGLRSYAPIEVKTATGQDIFTFTGIDLTFEKAFMLILTDEEFINGFTAYPLVAVTTSSELLEMGVPYSGTINLSLTSTNRSKTRWLIDRLVAPHQAATQLRKFCSEY